MRGVVRFVVLLGLLALPGAALAAPGHEREHPLSVAKARQLYNSKALPNQVAGVSVSPSEGVASYTESVTFTLTDPSTGAVELGLPAAFGTRSRNGRAYVPGRPSGSRRLTAADPSVSFDVGGLPAGTYELPVRRGGTTVGTVRFRLYAPRREGTGENESADGRAVFGPLERVPINASAGDGEESETFVSLSPLDPQRIVAYGNDIGGSGDGGAHLSDDGGATWKDLTFPETFNTPNGQDHELPSGDPILAADDLGDVWAGGLSICGSPSEQGRIFVNRLGPGETAFTRPNAGLPFLHTGNTCDVAHQDYGVLQDKPQMTIDGSPASPTYGRLYITWDDPTSKGNVNEVISYCDTRPNGYPDAAHCDTGANWSQPAVVSDMAGSYITSDVAVGPDGKVYMVWWDFSAANKISADMCTTPSQCGNSAGWGVDQTIASLSVRGTNKYVPFQCDTLAQPGGRAAPVPSITVDHSGGPNNGRIYVAWSDLDLSGSKRCSGSSMPSLTQDTFDSFVASAPDFATLTGGAPASGTRGTSIFPTDTGDHWFPWVAIDQSTGKAYVDLYTTKDDSTRTTTRFYESPITPGSGTPVSFDSITEVSTDSTTFADRPCCNFGNDYGDYTGLSAAQGVVAAVWTHRHLVTDAANVEVDLPSTWPAHVVAGTATIAEAAGADGDGRVEPGEPFTLTVPLHNAGPGTLDGVSAKASPMEPTVSLTSDTSPYGSLAAGVTNSASFTGVLSTSLPCGVSVDFRLAVTTSSDTAPRAVQVAVPTASCPLQPPAPPTTTTQTTTTTPPAPPLDRTPPKLRITYATRVDRKGRYTLRIRATGEAAKGAVVLRIGTGKRRVLVARQIATNGARAFKVVLKLRSRDFRLLKRRHRLRVRLTVSLADQAGNAARGSKTFTLRPRRR